MAEAANDESLVSAFESHLDETKEHRNRISEVCKLIDINPGTRPVMR